MEPTELLTPTVDKSQVPPLHQKRIVAFINHFLISSCSFLNNFAENCESRFIELERKMQRLEASLTIIEAKLASIPDETSSLPINEASKETTAPVVIESPSNVSIETIEMNGNEIKDIPPPPPPPAKPPGVKACEDIRYKKFFKMVQFGVPPGAVKMKMQAEGVDPTVLDTPNLELPDGSTS